MTASWQPYLFGEKLRLRPLTAADFDALYAAASDPWIWEQHPDRERHTRARFEIYFRSGIESQGALAVIDLKTGAMIGSSRYTGHNADASSVEIGYTFLTRDCWGGARNLELKTLMLNFAYDQVETAHFVIGKGNHRSRKAMTRIGGIEVSDMNSVPVHADPDRSIIYRIEKSEWHHGNNALILDQPRLSTRRLDLAPIDESHAEELCELFRDPELHTFVPFEPLTLEKQGERCARWSKRRSPDGKEIWLNWVARDRSSQQTIGHFQAGVTQEGVASIGYLVGRAHQRQGFSTEALQAVFTYLKDTLGVREVKAWADTRNSASHRLAAKLGMAQVGFIKGADFFKGARSDEFVFSKVFHP
jgi:RimJ/RimL family protein N-acetyltransferase